MRLIIIIIIFEIFFTLPSAFAGQALFYKEANLIGGYSDQDEWIGKSDMLKNSVGFEDYRKFSNDYGDFLTTDLQVRLSYDSIEASKDAWAIEIHNAWLEYKLGIGKTLRLGHFDSAFGLEPLLDTHSTLLQTIADKNIGFKKDWGIAFKGAGQSFDFETALQMGSGMSIYRRDGSFLATARIGSPSGNNLQYGLSLLYGEVLQTKGEQTFPRNELVSDEADLKKRMGIDAQYLFGPYLFRGEADYGKNNHQDVLGHFWEVDYTIPGHQNWEIGIQYQSWINDLNEHSSDDSTLSVGVSYKLNQNVTLRTAFMHDFNLMEGNEDDKILLQVYYFGK